MLTCFVCVFYVVGLGNLLRISILKIVIVYQVRRIPSDSQSKPRKMVCMIVKPFHEQDVSLFACECCMCFVCTHKKKLMLFVRWCRCVSRPGNRLPSNSVCRRSYSEKNISSPCPMTRSGQQRKGGPNTANSNNNAMLPTRQQRKPLLPTGSFLAFISQYEC